MKKVCWTLSQPRFCWHYSEHRKQCVNDTSLRLQKHATHMTSYVTFSAMSYASHDIIPARSIEYI